MADETKPWWWKKTWMQELSIDTRLFITRSFLTGKKALFRGTSKEFDPKDISYGYIAKAYNGVQFILENLQLLPGHGTISGQSIFSFCKDLKLIGYFLKCLKGSSNTVEDEAEVLAMDIVPAVDELLVALDTLRRNKCFCHERFVGIAEAIEELECDRFRDLAKRLRSAGKYDNKHERFLESTYSCEERSSRIDGNPILAEKIVIGFVDEARQLRDKLTLGQKQLQVISIVGMPGIGKTTLAKSLYNDLSVVYHFHIRAWVRVSQVYLKRKLLHSILSSILSCEDPVFLMSDEDMGEKLYKSLKRNTYLIVIDDVWDIEVWNELKIYFPDDDNSSRILMTSRNKDMALKVRQNSLIHCLRALTQEESWDLFNRKVFGDKSCPEELIGIGNKIVAKCKGLPLAIVVIAGFLAREKNQEESWRQVNKNIGSFINSSSNQFMDTLELSYKHLPSYLQYCFLYLGSFPQDSDISVRRLFQSWIAEGFIQRTNGKRLEDVAEDYLMDLVNRSLVIVATERSDGGIKSCNIHDMLRDLCLRKAKEKKFVLPICRCGPNATSFDDKSRLLMYQGRYPHFSHCQYFHSYNSHYVSENIVFNGRTLAVYKFLKTLELRHIILDNFPDQILHLLHLRYLALQLECLKVLPQKLFQLWKLETCILDGEKGGTVTLPCDIFKMAKLRHLKISQELHPEDLLKCSTRGQPGSCLQCFQEGLSQQHETSATVMPEDSSFPSSSSSGLFEKDGNLKEIHNTILENLQSLSQLCPAGFCNEVLARIPNLRKLGFHLTLSEGKDTFSFPDLSHLNQLEALKFEYQTFGMVPFSFPHPNMFPPSLRKLSLIGSHVDWKEMALMELLPNLEVLKIKDNFFNGPQWETTDHGFPCLKFLKLSHMDLLEWISSSSHFPSLEKIVLNGCLKLKEIPSEIGDIPTLETIEVYKSSPSTVESAREIQESNIGMGNNNLKVFIFHHFQEY